MYRTFFLVNYREELKTIFKSCLVHIRIVNEEHSANSETEILAEFINIILKENFCAPLSDKQFSIHSYEKELLNLAILADKCKAKQLVTVGVEVSNLKLRGPTVGANAILELKLGGI